MGVPRPRRFYAGWGGIMRDFGDHGDGLVYNARMKIRHLAFLALVACLTGCVPLDSLNPLYTDKDIVFDESLLGKWVTVGKDDQDVMEFVALKDDKDKPVGYTIYMMGHEDGRCTNLQYEARLVKIGERRFLDVMPKQWDAIGEGSVPMHIRQSKAGVSIEPRLQKITMAGYLEFSGGAQPRMNVRIAHWFVRLNTDGKKLQLDYVDDTKFLKAVMAQKFKLTHVVLGEGKSKDIVVTAGTRELQAFVLEHANDDDLFTEHISEMERK